MRTGTAPAMALAMSLLTTLANASVQVFTSDFIPDDRRALFNGFEGADGGSTYFLPIPVYVEDNIRVDQVNGDTYPDIDLYNSSWHSAGANGQSWYPNAGDYGYTRITLADGSDFHQLGLYRGTGGTTSRLFFELYDDAQLVASGSVSHTNEDLAQYLGFSGIRFDELLLAEDTQFGACVNTGVRTGCFNALALDSIEVAVPEPGSARLAAAALTSLLLLSGIRSRRRLGRG